MGVCGQYGDILKLKITENMLPLLLLALRNRRQETFRDVDEIHKRKERCCRPQRAFRISDKVNWIQPRKIYIRIIFTGWPKIVQDPKKILQVFSDKLDRPIPKEQNSSSKNPWGGMAFEQQ